MANWTRDLVILSYVFGSALLIEVRGHGLIWNKEAHELAYVLLGLSFSLALMISTRQS